MTPTAIITGASRGIGYSTALAFANKGYDLTIVCRSQIDKLNSLAEIIRAKGRNCITLCGDISNPTFAKEVLDTHTKAYQRLDVLVNNAGISKIAPLSDTSIEDWQEIISINLTGTYNMCYSALPHFLKYKNGHIINVSSMWGQVGASCEVAYSASKGGIDSFTKALGKELAPSNISVNAIAPGCVDTEMNAHLTEEEISALSEEIPAGRFATPDEIGQSIVLLAEMPTYMTGQIIRIDGGMI